jgi:hypothetical protein
MNRIFPAVAAAVIATVLSTAHSYADDKPLIWQPIKTSDTSYSVKLGLKLPTELEPEAGFDMGVDATQGGAVVNTPLKFWSSLKAQSIQRPAYEMNREIGFDVDGNAGDAAITMNYYEKHIATPMIDVERQGSYAVRYDGTSQQWVGVDVTQSVKVSRTASGTAVIVRASGINSFKRAGAGLGLEQKVGDYVTLTGSVDRMSGTGGSTASINASYAFEW